MASMRRLAEVLGLCPRGFLSNKNEMQRTVSHRYPGLSVPENGCKTGTGLKYKKGIKRKRIKGKRVCISLLSLYHSICKLSSDFIICKYYLQKKFSAFWYKTGQKHAFFEHRSNFCQLDVLMRKSVISIEKILTFLVKSIAISVKLCYTSSV